MNNILKTIAITGLSGFLTAWIGIFIGIILSIFLKNTVNRVKGTILGLLGGFMLGVVCFDLLPGTFEAGSIYIATIGIAMGLILSVILDGKLENNNSSDLNKNYNGYLKAAIFMSIGIGIHNLPSGVAIGSLIYGSPESGFHLIIALILHGIPEGLTLGILLSQCNINKLKLFLITVITSIPMGFGSVLGGLLKSPSIICISLGFASAMILYVTLRETLPAANETWRGRITTIGNVLGIIIGMLMISFLH